jgi:2-keto-3-deoxy-L-rhamnonate aldolase RhmA
MIPHVSTAEKARMLVDAIKFPPLGDRGLDGASLDSDFTIAGGEAYIDAANRETFLVVQIETPQAVENADEIAAVEGVDALFVGPGDLGLRLQRVATDLTLETAYRRVADAAEKHGKSWGCPASSLEQVGQLRELGARLLAYGGDFGAFLSMLTKCSQELDSIYGPRG